MMVLAVSRWAQRGTSGMIEGLAACFTGLEDPRETRRCDHQLIDILVIAVCAVIACAESWEDIEPYGRSKQAWLKTFLALPNGIPSHDTFRRVFMLLDPDGFEACFARWARSLAGEAGREVVAIDGKTARRSGNRRHGHGPLHLVSAWASEQGLVLGQRAVDGKSNEITAVPELLATLRLEGCIVTLDAMGCQKEIAERIRAKGADYLSWCSRPTTATPSRPCASTSSAPASASAPVAPGRCSTPSRRATAAWSAGASSWTRRRRISSPCAAGPS